MSHITKAFDKFKGSMEKIGEALAEYWQYSVSYREITICS